jgi:hypothetical protein
VRVNDKKKTTHSGGFYFYSSPSIRLDQERPMDAISLSASVRMSAG